MKTLLTVIIMLVACAAAAQDSKPKRAYDPQGQIIDSPNYSKLRDTMIVVRWVERDGRAYNDNNGAAYSSERDQKFFHALRLCRERGHAYGIPSLHTRMHREFLGMKGLLHADDHRAQVELALDLRDRYPDARLAVTWAGIIPYLHGGRCIDILGKCDRRIAHSAPHAGETVPGHTKWDYEYSIIAQRPDIIVALWKDTASVCRQITGSYAYGPAGVRIRKDYAATVAARK